MSIWDEWAKNPLYGQLIQDPTYTALTPAFQKQIHDILFNYGITPSGDQAVLAGSSIDNNPYSVLNRLKQGQVASDHNSINAANAAGLGESGAAAGALNANAQTYKANEAGAVADATGQINSAVTGYAGAVGSVFDRLQAQAAAAAAAPPPEPTPTWTGAPDPGPAPSSFMPPDMGPGSPKPVMKAAPKPKPPPVPAAVGLALRLRTGRM